MIPKNIERRIRQQIQAKKHNFFAVVQPGFENTVLHEISRLGLELSNIKVIEGGIEFSAGIKDVWKINYLSRCITRILMRIIQFNVIYFEKFRDRIASVPWELYLNPGCMPKFSIKCRHSRLYHTGRLEEECRTGIIDHIKNYYNDDTLDKTQNNQNIFIRFENDTCTLSIDTTGDPLYKRGIRKYITEAPIRETLASCMLYEAGIENAITILDPMCGSGVIPIEAAFIMNKTPSGIARNFAFEDWPGHRGKAFNYFKRTIAEKENIEPREINIYGSDIDEKAIEITRFNIDNTNVAKEINISRKDFFSTKRKDFPEGRMLIATNPPYGGRMKVDNTIEFYREISRKLCKDFSGSAFAIIVPGSKAEKAFVISPIKRIPFMNGGKRVILLTGIC